MSWSSWCSRCLSRSWVMMVGAARCFSNRYPVAWPPLAGSCSVGVRAPSGPCATRSVYAPGSARRAARRACAAQTYLGSSAEQPTRVDVRFTAQDDGSQECQPVMRKAAECHSLTSSLLLDHPLQRQSRQHLPLLHIGGRDLKPIQQRRLGLERREQRVVIYAHAGRIEAPAKPEHHPAFIEEREHFVVVADARRRHHL